ncbi:hypothetical protein Trydic_g9129 [Trypoxylus dichotomus]
MGVTVAQGSHPRSVRASSEPIVEWRPKRTSANGRAARRASQQGSSVGGQGTGPDSVPRTSRDVTSPRPGPARQPVPASRPSPTRPDPQSQSLSRSYGSNLPTSLTYIILSTRGSSPWRPAADMGTNRRDASTWPSPGFSRSFWVAPTNSLMRARLNNGSAAGFRNRNRIPFRPTGSTDSCATAVHTKPFSTSVLQGLAGVFATTTKICTDGGSRLAHAWSFCAHRRDPPTRQGFMTIPTGPSHMPLTAEYKHDASAPSIFRASNFGRRFNSAFGSSHSASSAYQKWPTWHSDPISRGFIVQASRRSHPFKV